MTAHRPQPRPGVLDIAPYIPGKSSAPGVAKVFKLSSNETPLGPGASTIAAYRMVAEHLEDYPDGSAAGLRQAIGDVFGLDPARIVCGAGSDDLLNLIARAYLADGDEAIHTTHGFLVYPIATMGTGAKPVVAPEKNFTADVDAILKCVTPRTKVVFLANPNNPTGTYIPFDEVKRLHKGLPAQCGAGARRGLCRIRAAQRLRVRHRAGGHVGKRRDDAAPSPRSTGWPRCASAGCMARRISSTRSTASAGRSTSTRRRSPPASRRSAIARMSSMRARTMRSWLAWLTRGNRQTRPAGNAERGQFRADPFPRDARATPPRTPTPS